MGSTVAPSVTSRARSRGLPVDARGDDLAADGTHGLQGLARGGAAGQLSGRSVGAFDGDGLPGHGGRG